MIENARIIKVIAISRPCSVPDLMVPAVNRKKWANFRVATIANAESSGLPFARNQYTVQIISILIQMLFAGVIQPGSARRFSSTAIFVPSLAHVP
jgi:hypothetical protein